MPLPADPRAEHPGIGDLAFLNAASQGLAPRAALVAVRAHLDRLEQGPRERDWGRYVTGLDASIEAARREVATLLGAAMEEVGLVPDTTAGLHAALDAIPFAEGDNIVLSDLEYPQVALAAANVRREHGVEIRLVPHRGGRVELDDLRSAADARTRAFLASSVGWVTGQRIDLGALSELAVDREAFLVVDAIQELGVRPIEVGKLAIDFLASGAYKWLNAPFGTGLFYANARVHERGLRVRRLGLQGLVTPEGGWGAFYGSPGMVPLPSLGPSPTVRRFEVQGTPSAIGATGLAATLAARRSLDDGEVERHVLGLTGELVDRLVARGARVLTPRADAERAGIVTFTLGGNPAEDEALRAHLEARGVVVSARYCSGVGGVRAACHFFNDLTDVERLIAGLESFPA